MSHNVGTKLCSTKGCHSQFSDNGNHDCCPVHSPCYDSGLAVYRPSNCEQCQQWISQLRKSPHSFSTDGPRDKLVFWVSKLQKCRRERYLPGNVVKDTALASFIFNTETPSYRDNGRDLNGLYKKSGRDLNEQSPPRHIPQQNRSVRCRLIVSDDSEEDEEKEPPEKRSRSQYSPKSEFELDGRNIQSPEFNERSCTGLQSPQSEHSKSNERRSRSRQSSHSSQSADELSNFDDAPNPSGIQGDISELPSMEDVAKTMSWLVQSVGNIQNILLRKQIVKSENLIQSNELPDFKQFKAAIKTEIYEKLKEKGSAEATVGKNLQSQQENTSSGDSLPSGDYIQDNKIEKEKLTSAWVPLPKEFRLEMSEPIPRVKVPVMNKWIVLSPNQCKVRFCNTLPFIKYVESDDGEPKSISESEKVADPSTNAKNSTVYPEDVESHSDSQLSEPENLHNELVTKTANDDSSAAESSIEDLDKMWKNYIDGNSFNGFASFSISNIIGKKPHMNEVHMALSAPQIGVEDTARLLRIKLRKLPLASYKEEKLVRAQLLRLMNSIQTFQSLITTFKASVVNWREEESDNITDFFQGFEASMLTLESACKFALVEFFRVRKALREKLFHRLKLDIDTGVLIRSSPFSEGFFHPSAVNEFLSQLPQQHLLPSDTTKKKTRSPKKVVFSKKNFTLPKKKGQHTGRRDDKKSRSDKHKSKHSKDLSRRPDKLKREKEKLKIRKIKLEKDRSVTREHEVSDRDSSSEDW